VVVWHGNLVARSPCGGLSAVLYGEAVQLILFLLVLLPLTTRMLTRYHGIRGLIAGLPSSSQHTFGGLPWFAPHASADIFGTVVGLGFVLSFSYWCADFLLIQRVLAARNSRAMAQTPMLAITAKLVLPLLLVTPGLAAARIYGASLSASYDLALPRMLIDLYPTKLLAVSLAAIFASLFIGMCGNLAASVSIFNYDLYQSFLRPGASDQHYLRVSRLTAVVVSFASVGAAYLAFTSNSLMEYVQLVLSSLYTPLATTLLLGIFVPSLARRSGLPAMLSGTIFGAVHSALALIGYLHYGSGLATSFYTAILSAGTTTLVMFAISLSSQWQTASTRQISKGLSNSEQDAVRDPMIWGLSAGCCIAVCILYVLFF